MKIALPEGFAPPKNARPGEPFEVVATVTQAEDGSYDLVAIDGTPVPDEEEMTEEVPMDPRTDASNIKLPFEEE